MLAKTIYLQAHLTKPGLNIELFAYLSICVCLYTITHPHSSTAALSHPYSTQSAEGFRVLETKSLNT